MPISSPSKYSYSVPFFNSKWTNRVLPQQKGPATSVIQNFLAPSKTINEGVYSLELKILSKKRLYAAIFDTLRDIFHMGNFINQLND